MQVRTASSLVVTENACRCAIKPIEMHHFAGDDAMDEENDLEAFDDKKEKDLTVRV